MKKLFAIVAMPVYAVAIGLQYCALAAKFARVERRLKREAKAAEEEFLAHLRAERVRAAYPADENEWGIN